MRTLDQINEQKDLSNAAVKSMEAEIQKLNGLIESLENDKSRSHEYLLKAAQDEREKVLPFLAEKLKIVREAADYTRPQKQYWESRAYLMSLQRFNPDDAAKDSIIKQGWTSEIERMPAALLELAWQSAVEDNNLPLMWQIFRTGQRMGAGNAGFAQTMQTGLASVVIPDQAAALAAISVCESNHSHADRIAAVATGLRQDPTRKMSVGRQQQQTSKLVEAAEAVEAAAAVNQ